MVRSLLVSAGVKDSGSPAEAEEEAEDAHPTAERSTNASSSPGRRVSVLYPDHTLVKSVGAYGESDFRRRNQPDKSPISYVPRPFALQTALHLSLVLFHRALSYHPLLPVIHQ